MTTYDSADQLYACVRRAFDQIDARHFDPLHDAGLVVHFICDAPVAQMVLDGRQQPVATTFGTNSLPANLTVWLDADTLHQIMLGELPLLKALGQKKIRAKGPLLKIRALADVFAESQKIYPQILAEEGLG